MSRGFPGALSDLIRGHQILTGTDQTAVREEVDRSILAGCERYRRCISTSDGSRGKRDTYRVVIRWREDKAIGSAISET